MYHEITQQFAHLGHRLTTVLQAQIDDKRHELTRIHTQKQDANFSAEQERARLDQIGALLTALHEQAAAQVSLAERGA
jgi:exonuclease VII large subunit